MAIMIQKGCCPCDIGVSDCVLLANVGASSAIGTLLFIFLDSYYDCSDSLFITLIFGDPYSIEC